MDTTDIEAELKKEGLNLHRAPVVAYLVRCIANHGDTNPVRDPNSERSIDIYAIGEALNALGNSDEDGLLYMQVACRSVEKIYGWRPSWLNMAWDRIGYWMA